MTNKTLVHHRLPKKVLLSLKINPNLKVEDLFLEE